MRIRERRLSRKLILAAVDSFEIIEEYPHDKYLPSFLVYAKHQDLEFHVQIAADMESNNVRIITAYIPSTERWGEDFKKRRKP
jgi:hypothetical protein